MPDPAAAGDARELLCKLARSIQYGPLRGPDLLLGQPWSYHRRTRAGKWRSCHDRCLYRLEMEMEPEAESKWGIPTLPVILVPAPRFTVELNLSSVVRLE